MEQDRIWDYYQNVSKEGFSSNTGRLSYLASKIRCDENVLTIGVGDLYLERLLFEKGCELFILDPSENSVELGQKLFGLDDESAKRGYSQDIPFSDQSVDVVVMSEVLEHLTDEVLTATVSEVFRVLKPGGRFLGTVPFEENLKQSEVMCPNCSNVFHKVGHVQSFTASRLMGFLSDCFDPEKGSVQVSYLPSWKILNLRGKVVSSLIKCLEMFGVHSSKSNLVFEMRK